MKKTVIKKKGEEKAQKQSERSRFALLHYLPLQSLSSESFLQSIKWSFAFVFFSFSFFSSWSGEVNEIFEKTQNK